MLQPLLGLSPELRLELCKQRRVGWHAGEILILGGVEAATRPYQVPYQRGEDVRPYLAYIRLESQRTEKNGEGGWAEEQEGALGVIQLVVCRVIIEL